MPEPLIQLLAALPPAEPDPARAERVRTRCRARLAREVPRAVTSRPAGGATAAQLWQPLIAVLSVVYLTEVVLEAIRFYGRFLE